MNTRDAEEYRNTVLSAAKRETTKRVKRRAKTVKRLKKEKKDSGAPKKPIQRKKHVRMTAQNKPRIAAIIAASPSVSAAARTANVSRTTIDHALNDPEMREYIKETVLNAADEAEVTVAEVLREWKRVGMQNSAKFVRRVGDRLIPDFSRVTYGDMAAVTELNFDEHTWIDHRDKAHRQSNTKVKLGGKMQALDMIAKYFRMYGGEIGGGGAGGAGLPASVAMQAPALLINFVEPKKKEQEKETA